MIRRFWAIAPLLVALSFGGIATASPRHQPAVTYAPSMPPVDITLSSPVRRGDVGGAVRILQTALTNAGWPVVVDGVFGPRTERTVMLFQRANGLVVDGIAGQKTLTVLGLWGPAFGPLVPQPLPQPLPQPSPVVASRAECAQWVELAAQVGWPQARLSWLEGIMWRESGCRPSAYNGSGNDQSYGLLQINTKGALWGELQRRCGLVSRDQLWDAQINLSCGYTLYLVYGTRPWRLG